jgi:hypothetical protein
MLIHLNDSLIDNRGTDLHFYDCIRMIMLAYKEGSHIIVLRPKNVKKLLNDVRINGTTKQILKHYQNHTSKHAKIFFKYFALTIEIVPSDSPENFFCDITTRLEIRQVCSKHFSESSNIQRTIILGENQDDSVVYGLIGKYYLKKNGLDANTLRTDERFGGGNTTNRCYKTIYDGCEAFCLCILDCDQKTPDGSIGDTAKFVKKFHDKNHPKNKKCSYYILNVLEIENILPPSFYKIQYQDDLNKKPILQRLDDLPFANIKYFDFKKGIRCEKLHNGMSYAKYWRNVLSIDCTPDEDAMEKINKKQPCGLEESSNCKIIKGFGNDVLNDFIEYQKTADLFSVVSDSTAEIATEWLKLGQVVACFCCGGNKIRAI